MDIIMKLSILLAVGMIGGRVANKLKLPNVSGYLVFGVLLGPSLLNVITEQDVVSLDIINQLALAFIAFSIGSEFVMKDMISYGKRIFILTIFEVIGAIGVVFFVMYVLFSQPFALSLVVASMSAATAPAAT